MNKRYYKNSLKVCGNIADLYCYENPVIINKKNRRIGRSNSANTSTETKIANRKLTALRSRRKVIDLINSNYLTLNKFFTLTFAENITDIKQANKFFKEFIQRLNYFLKKNNYSKLKYIAVIEFQKRGAIHYHLLCNLPFIDCKVLETIWTHGFIKINKLDNIDNVGLYVSKYMTKNPSDSRLLGKKCFFTSKNLNKPIIYKRDININAVISSFEIEKTEIDEYESDYYGKVLHIRYKLKTYYKPIKIEPQVRLKELNKKHFAYSCF